MSIQEEFKKLIGEQLDESNKRFYLDYSKREKEEEKEPFQKRKKEKEKRDERVPNSMGGKCFSPRVGGRSQWEGMENSGVYL